MLWCFRTKDTGSERRKGGSSNSHVIKIIATNSNRTFVDPRSDHQLSFPNASVTISAQCVSDRVYGLNNPHQVVLINTKSWEFKATVCLTHWSLSQNTKSLLVPTSSAFSMKFSTSVSCPNIWRPLKHICTYKKFHNTMAKTVCIVGKIKTIVSFDSS